MPWGIVGAAVIGAGASIYGSGKASDAQSKAAAQAGALQKEQYDQTRADLSPYRDAGVGATGALSDAYGLNGQGGYDRAFANFRADPGYDFLLQAMAGFMSLVDRFTARKRQKRDPKGLDEACRGKSTRECERPDSKDKYDARNGTCRGYSTKHRLEGKPLGGEAI